MQRDSNHLKPTIGQCLHPQTTNNRTNLDIPSEKNVATPWSDYTIAAHRTHLNIEPKHTWYQTYDAVLLPSHMFRTMGQTSLLYHNKHSWTQIPPIVPLTCLTSGARDSKTRSSQREAFFHEKFPNSSSALSHVVFIHSANRSSGWKAFLNQHFSNTSITL